MLLHLSCYSYILYKWQGITVMLFSFILIFFQNLNFILPRLIILVSKFLLVILVISPSFLQDIKIALPLDAVNLVCSDIDILNNQIRSFDTQFMAVGCCIWLMVLVGHFVINKCEFNWSCTVGSQNSSCLTSQVLVIHCCQKFSDYAACINYYCFLH